MRDGNPQILRVVVERTGAALAAQATVAASFISRLVGLLGRTGLSPGEALIIPRCQSIHMCGMRFPIDAVFVDRAWRVVALYERLRPWRLTRLVLNAWAVIELPAGTVLKAGVAQGDRLHVQPAPGASAAEG